MRNIVTVYRLLNIAAKDSKESLEEAKALEKAFKKGGNATLSFHIKVANGEVTGVWIGNWCFNAFETKSQELKNE